MKLRLIHALFSILGLIIFNVGLAQVDNKPKGQKETPTNKPAPAQDQSDQKQKNSKNQQVIGQNDDLSKTKVEDMSDAQVRDMVKKMGESGMSEQQLEQAAQERGMDAMQVQLLKQRIAKLKNQKTSDEDEAENKEEEDPEKSTTRGTPKPSVSRIFGSQLFSAGFTSFEPNLRLATPPNYVIGPDDELLLDITGDNEASYKLRVSPEGVISVEYVGKIAVGGLTIDEAKDKIKAAMSGTYAGLRTGRTNLALNLGNIRSIKVIITGEVTKPGTYTLPSVASVFNALYASGGPNERGSFRNIQIIRGNQIIATVDLYDFLINGIQTGNIRLEDQDIIHIPVYQIHVDVLGEVKRSAIYEVRSGESLVDVLRYAGGFSDMAYKARVKIVQNTANAQKLLIKTLTEFPDYIPKNGDKVFVDAIFDKFENKIQITGAVTRPGMYEFKPGQKITDLIKLADGLSGDVFMNRSYILRVNDDNTTSVISFDLSEAMRGGPNDIELKKDDIVQISSIFDLRDEYTISVGGEVRRPGSFSYSNNLTVETLIQMAGGFKIGASPMNIEISRRTNGVDLSQKTAPTAQVFNISVDSSLQYSQAGFQLQPFDIVSVRPKEGYTVQQQIRIEGEVIHPGIYTLYTKNERISDIVKRAGGLTAFAYTEGASLTRYSPTANTDTVLAPDLVGIELDKILALPNSRLDLILIAGDVIKVPSLLQTVKVDGEVMKPMSVVFDRGRGLKYYVINSGGFTKSALKRRTYVSYASGAVRGTKKFLFFNKYPEIKPGSEIFVPLKAERKGISFEGWAGIGTALASVAAIIFAILRQ